MVNRYTSIVLREEYERVLKRNKTFRVLRRLFVFLIAISLVVLLEGNSVICVKDNEYKNGDIIAFYYNDKILVRRLISNFGPIKN